MPRVSFANPIPNADELKTAAIGLSRDTRVLILVDEEAAAEIYHRELMDVIWRDGEGWIPHDPEEDDPEDGEPEKALVLYISTPGT